MRALHYSVVMKRELLKKAKLSIFKTVFGPSILNLTYGHESWVMTERVRSQECKRPKWGFYEELKELHFLTRCLTLRYFYELKDFSFDGRPCKQNASGTSSQTSFTCQSQWEKTSWGGVEDPSTQKKNPRPRTDFSRIDALEAKDRNARGQGHDFASGFKKKKKKKSLRRNRTFFA